jgi:hypothetical protein
MSTIQTQATPFPGRRIPSETWDEIVTRVAATANPEDLALVERLTMKQLPRHTETIEITPAAAALILRDHNSANRLLRLPRGQMWARVMERGEFRVTKDGVAFDVNGLLCDGQHRFLAVAIHGSPVNFDVVLSEAVESRETYDAGTPRSAADILHMHGATDVTIRQAVVKIAVGYQQKLEKKETVPMDRAQVVEQAELHAHRLATAIGLARNSLEKPESPTIAGWLPCLNLNTTASVAFLMLQGGWQSAETGAFLNHLQVGIGEGENHPIPVGASLLLKDRRSKAKGLTINQKIAITLQANWLWRLNKRQALRGAPKDLMTYARPAELPPDLMGDGIPLPTSPLTQ